MGQDSHDTEDLRRRASVGDEAALAAVWERHRARLGQMVRLQLDRRLQGRVDPSDVLQEAYLDLVSRLGDYARCTGSGPSPWPV
jgi:RNA polymerase sigma-70 factor (ECF subfamily)